MFVIIKQTFDKSSQNSISKGLIFSVQRGFLNFSMIKKTEKAFSPKLPGKTYI